MWWISYRDLVQGWWAMHRWLLIFVLNAHVMNSLYVYWKFWTPDLVFLAAIHSCNHKEKGSALKRDKFYGSRFTVYFLSKYVLQLQVSMKLAKLHTSSHGLYSQYLYFRHSPCSWSEGTSVISASDSEESKVEVWPSLKKNK